MEPTGFDSKNPTMKGAASAGSAAEQQYSNSNHLGIPVQYNQTAPMGNGSPVGRPHSSASTCSTASYHTANTVHTSNGANFGHPGSGQYHPHSHGAGPSMYPPGSGGYTRPHPNYSHHPQAHPGGHRQGLIRPAGRYAMPPRNNTGMNHPLRPLPTRMGAIPRQPHASPAYGEQQYYQNPSHASGGNVPPPPPPPPPHGQNMYSQESQGQYQPPNQQTMAGSKQPLRQVQNDNPNVAPDTKQGAGEKGLQKSMGEQGEGNETMSQEESQQQEQDHQQPEYASNAGPTAHPPQGMHHGGYAEPPYQSYHSNSSHHYDNHQNYGQFHPNDIHSTNAHRMRYGGYHHHHGAGGISPPLLPYAHSMQYQNHMVYHGGPPRSYGHQQGPYTMAQEQQQHPLLPPPPPQGGFQLPQYARRGSYDPSPETTDDSQAISRSPSPPPRPPSAAQQQDNDSSGKAMPSQALSGRSTSIGSINSTNIKKNNAEDAKPTGHGALSDRGVNDNSQKEAAGKESTGTDFQNAVGGKPKNEDATADAASILLQLCSVVKNDESEENIGPGRSTVEKSNSMNDATGAPVIEQQDSAPDLTSEPSSDSIDQQLQHRPKPPDSEFPCPIPEKYPTRLCLPYDNSKLNSLHCFLRSELLEIFVVQKSANKSPTHSPGSSVGRVGLRCVHCAMNRKRNDRDEAPMAVFYPKSVTEIYRLVTSWQRCHLRKCRNLPPSVRSQWQELRENDKSRGKTHYWVTSAKQIGIMDCTSRAGGIRFAPDFDASDLPPESRLVSASSTEEAMDLDLAEVVPTKGEEDEAMGFKEKVVATTEIESNDSMDVPHEKSSLNVEKSKLEESTEDSEEKVQENSESLNENTTSVQYSINPPVEETTTIEAM